MKAKRIKVLGSAYHGDLVIQVLSRNGYDCSSGQLTRNPIEYIRLFFSADVFFVVFGGFGFFFLFFFVIPLRFFGKKIYIEWIGTDVLNLLGSKWSKIRGKILNRFATNLCECDWIQRELLQCGICAIKGPFITFHDLFLKLENGSSSMDGPQVVSARDRLVCVTYSGQGREDLYSIPEILETIGCLSYVELHVLGHNGQGLPKRNNVIYHGWVSKEDVSSIYCATDLFIRYTKHDGLAYSVLEAMYLGLTVAYSYTLPETFKINESDDLRRVVDILWEKKNNFVSTKSESAKYFIQKNFIENRVSEINLVNLIS